MTHHSPERDTDAPYPRLVHTGSPAAGHVPTPVPAAGSTEMDDLRGYGELDARALDIPLRETVPPQAARDLMASAGIDMDGFDRALADARTQAEAPSLVTLDLADAACAVVDRWKSGADPAQLLRDLAASVTEYREAVR
ncbi:hypothetical protein [Isoptericola aurantiacus]|uniref:hypothetical protein n=1 Tax=Isoptericola aurantiacus TaxID=3377839 RepID=UPI00383B5B17